MTDSSIETNSGDGAFDAGSSVDELFGEFAEESLEGEPEDDTADDPSAETAATDDADEGVEDQTAADVFSQLRAAAENDADEVLADESPEDIIASADEPDVEPELDDDLRVDDDALADLLLTGRTKEKEFLWIDSESDDAASGALEDDEPSAPAATSEAEADAEPTLENDSDAEDELEAITDADASTESLEDVTRSDVGAEDGAPATEETALAPTDEETLPATSEDEQPSGFFGWLRSKLGGLF